MPSARFQHHTTATTDLETAWHSLQNPATWGDMAGVEEITNVAHSESGGLISFAFVAVIGGRAYPGLGTTLTSEQLRSMSLRIQSKEMDGVISVALSLTGEQRVLIEAELDLDAKGLLATMFFSVITGVVGSGFPQQLEAFATRLSDTVD